MDSEQIDMYHTLTLIDNQAVKRIPEKLSRVLQAILSSRKLLASQSELSTYYYFGEQHCDALLLLGHLSQISGNGQNEFSEFSEFLRSSVITHYKIGGELYSRRLFRDSDSEELCGLSLYLPETEQTASHYSSLNLYQKVDLISLYRGIFVS